MTSKKMKNWPIVLALTFISTQTIIGVSWKPATPIEFYQDATLACIFDENSNGIPKWTGGFQKTILAYNEISLNKDKYFVVRKHQFYNLSIKHFSEEDVNVVYTCISGFTKYSRNLSLEESSFESLPNETAIHKKVTLQNRTLDLNVTFEKIWPNPECSLVVGGLQLTNMMRNSSERKVLFTYYSYYLHYEVDQLTSKLYINMSCKIGNRWKKIIFQNTVDNSNYTTEKGKGSHNTTILVPIVTSVMLVLSCLFLLILLMRRGIFWIVEKRVIKNVVLGYNGKGVSYGGYKPLSRNNSTSNFVAAGSKSG